MKKFGAILTLSAATLTGPHSVYGQTITVDNSSASNRIKSTDNVGVSSRELSHQLSEKQFPDVQFPPTNAQYHLGDLPLKDNAGIFHLNGNSFEGRALGTPETGKGLFASTYTNPWNVVTHLKYELDPAALKQADHVTNLGLSIECQPNRPNQNNPNPSRNWVACIYRGMDSGTGGGNGTSINSEIDNDVLNLSSNSATDMEIDVNFNGHVRDGGWSRGLFLTGGGAPGNQTNSVALEIMHRAYDHSWLPWTTGIAIRDAETMIQMHKSHADEPGFFIRTFDQNQLETSHLDKNGYLDVQGLRLIATSTPTHETSCKKGQVTWDDNFVYLCVSGGKFKKIALQSL